MSWQAVLDDPRRKRHSRGGAALRMTRRASLVGAPAVGRAGAICKRRRRIENAQVCDAERRMSEIGLAPGADAERSRPLSWRARGRDLLAGPRARYVVGVVALGVLYRGVAQIGYELQFAGPVAAIAWLPVGVGIAFLYLGGLRYWPGVLLGDL